MSVLGSIGIAYRARLLLLGDDLIDGIRNKKVSLVIVANDCGPASLKKLTDKCKSFDVKLVRYASKLELAMAIGKINVASVGIKDERFADKLFKEIENEKSKEGEK
jgi:ribosomal protein L7Ae-like RNA K-turn-binding protein